MKTCFHKLYSRQEVAEEHSNTWQSREVPAWAFPGEINSGTSGTGNGESSKLCQASRQPRSTNI